MTTTIKVPVNINGKRSKIEEILRHSPVIVKSASDGSFDHINFVQIKDGIIYLLQSKPSDAYDIYDGRADKKLSKKILQIIEDTEDIEVDEKTEQPKQSVQNIKKTGYLEKEVSAEIEEEEKKAYEVILRKAVRELGNGDYTIKVSVFDNTKSSETLVNNKGVENARIFIQLKDGSQRYVSIQDCIKMLTLFDVIKEVEEVFGAFSLNFQEKLINIKDAETPIGMEKLKEIVSNFI